MRDYLTTCVVFILVLLSLPIFLKGPPASAARVNVVEREAEFVFIRNGSRVQNEELRDGVFLVLDGGAIQNCAIGSGAVVILRGGTLENCRINGGWIVGDTGFLGTQP